MNPSKLVFKKTSSEKEDESLSASVRCVNMLGKRGPKVTLTDSVEKEEHKS